jgi:alanyl-tRNA synthetase
MQTLTSAQIRETFLAFFERHGHTRVPSSSLVVADDPTLLFANSGMVQFKDVFLGREKRPYRRAATAQKCLRVSGKHNDLEEVGPSPRHHTFFEMLGNFSFGDYFKAEAIRMAWQLLVDEFKLPVERLWFTVFAGDDEVPADEEAAALWIAQGADPARVLRFGRKDNFWTMGDSGPCGPCSEITMYIGDDLSKMRPDGVNSDDPDYVEIWNNVFMQYDRATMQPLPKPSVDTGMGLERMAMVMQGVHSTYETDLFARLLKRIQALRGADTEHYAAHRSAYRAIADHARSIAFLIADGVLPGNVGRSYVLRRILRRAAYQGRAIGFERPFLGEVIATVISEMGTAYPDLVRRAEFILSAADAEERQFLRTLAGGVTRLQTLIEQVRREGGTQINGGDAFVLKDTYGFPLDLTQKVAGEAGLTVDEAGYDAALQAQRERSRAAAGPRRGADTELWQDLQLPATEFVGYRELSCEATVLALAGDGELRATAAAGEAIQFVLDRTACYGESGGQVGDQGELRTVGGALVRIDDVQRPLPGVFVHSGTVLSGTLAVDERGSVSVDALRRADIQRNHTATHLLQRALRDTVGEHAAQAGSLVAPDRLRFDYTHGQALDAAAVRAIEQRLNSWIRADAPVSWNQMTYPAALDAGAIALFGEKYGDIVRVVEVETPEIGERDYSSRRSVELCGGTHVTRTGEIGSFRIVTEASIGSGIRRIEALTGRAAEQWQLEQRSLIQELAERLQAQPQTLLERLEHSLAEQRRQRQELDALRAKVARGALDAQLAQVTDVAGVKVLAAQVAAEDADRLREQGDYARDRLGSAVIVLGTVIGDKPQLLAAVTPDLVKRGLHAGQLVKALAGMLGGGGGGRPELAMAGGKSVERLGEALAAVNGLVAEQVRP